MWTQKGIAHKIRARSVPLKRKLFSYHDINCINFIKLINGLKLYIKKFFSYANSMGIMEKRWDTFN